MMTDTRDADPSDALLDILLGIMASASSELRAELVKAGRRVLPNEMRRARRDRLVRRLRSRFYGDVSDRLAAKFIAADFVSRSGIVVHSTNDQDKDQLIDNIILIALPPSSETIRSEIFRG